MKKIKFIFLLITIVSYSQTRLNFDEEFRILSHQDSIKIFTKDLLHVYNSDLKKIRESEILFNHKIKDFEIFENGDSIYFVSINSGLVYTLNDKDLFKRIDKSYDHKMQSDSSVIFEKDTIFKFGGYGFWSMRNLMTYYDSKQSEWFPKPNSEKGLDEGYSNSILLSDNDDFYILGGYKMNGLLEISPNKKVHYFDGNKEKWTEIGEINSNISNKDFYFVLGSDFYLINESNVQKYDVKNNSITSYKKHSLLYKAGLKKHTIIIKENQVFFVTMENNDLYLNSLSLNELLGNPINKKNFIKTNYSPIYMLVIIVLLIFLFFRKNEKINSKKITVSKNQLLIGRKSIDISNFHFKIIKLLIQNKKILNKDFDTLNKNQYLNKYHFQRTLKNEIFQINLTFKSLINKKEEMIIIYKDNTDKRINIYQLNNNFNFILKEN
tara:strand:+ start:3755 stop:5065 length:1311 start_codon:yes stop_codon:yes gene_type:complete